ncbi:hypothetical protein ACJJTC_010833 [Scirpophaga incertulas]
MNSKFHLLFCWSILEAPTPADIAKDGFDKGLSWEDIQKASNSVAPRMFGKQATSTHLAGRNLILERSRDLHESSDSRPPESVQERKRSRRELFVHSVRNSVQVTTYRNIFAQSGEHCVNHWIEGYLSDDMGLGKTITMISLVLGDKEGDIEEDDDDEEPGKSKFYGKPNRISS